MLAPQAARGTNEAFSTTKTFRGYCVARITSGRAARLSDGVASGGDHTRLSYPGWPDNWQLSGCNGNWQSEGKMNYIERYWRDATPEDAIKEPPMVARFTYYPDGFPGNFETVIDVLRGVFQNKPDRNTDWFDSKGNRYGRAQVYDAPDPGEGWRLIDVDSENLLAGDEVWTEGGKWEPIQTILHYGRRCVIRRRITPAVTYVPFTWEDREQLRGRWIKEGDNVEIQVTAFHCNSKGVFYSEGRSAKVLVERWRFLDTGKPVGKEVTQ